jgi:hypothetical protein
MRIIPRGHSGRDHGGRSVHRFSRRAHRRASSATCVVTMGIPSASKLARRAPTRLTCPSPPAARNWHALAPQRVLSVQGAAAARACRTTRPLLEIRCYPACGAFCRRPAGRRRYPQRKRTRRVASRPSTGSNSLQSLSCRCQTRNTTEFMLRLRYRDGKSGDWQCGRCDFEPCKVYIAYRYRIRIHILPARYRSIKYTDRITAIGWSSWVDRIAGRR